MLVGTMLSGTTLAGTMHWRVQSWRVQPLGGYKVDGYNVGGYKVDVILSKDLSSIPQPKPAPDYFKYLARRLAAIRELLRQNSK